jgi:hypothetical protein
MCGGARAATRWSRGVSRDSWLASGRERGVGRELAALQGDVRGRRARPGVSARWAVRGSDGGVPAAGEGAPARPGRIAPPESTSSSPVGRHLPPSRASPAPAHSMRVAQERVAMEKTFPQVADRSLRLAFGLRAIGPAHAHSKASVPGEPGELEIAHEPTAPQAIIAREHRPHLVEQQLAWPSAPRGEACLETLQECAEILAWVKLHPQWPGVAEHHEECVAHAPGQSAVREIDLRLVSGFVSKRTTGSGAVRSRRTKSRSCMIPPAYPAARHSASKRVLLRRGYSARRASMIGLKGSSFVGCGPRGPYWSRMVSSGWSSRPSSIQRYSVLRPTPARRAASALSPPASSSN